MRAAVFHGRRDVRVEEVAEPVPGRDEILLRIHATGICGTDAHEYAHGPAMFPIAEVHPVTGHVGPMIPGHEFAGTVVAVGADVEGFAEDELVVSGAGISCGHCVYCKRGSTNLCQRYATVGLQRHGALAGYCAVPASTCLPVRDLDITSDAAALAQPMAIAVHAMRRVDLRPDDEAVVVGAGGIGAFLTFAAASTGCRVHVVDPDPDRLSMARDLGAHRVCSPEGDGSVRDALDLRDGHPTVVYEVSGTTAGLHTAWDLVAPGGRIVQVSLHSRPAELPLRQLALREVDIVGTNAHVCADDLPEALRLLGARQGPWSDVAPVAIALDELIVEGLEPLSEGHGGRIKTLVDPWADARRPTQM